MDTKEIEFLLQPSLDIFERNGHWRSGKRYQSRNPNSIEEGQKDDDDAEKL